MMAKEFDKLKAVKTHTHTRKALEDKCRQKCLQNRHVDTVATTVPQDNVQHMEKDAQPATKLATLEWYAGAGDPNP